MTDIHGYEGLNDIEQRTLFSLEAQPSLVIPQEPAQKPVADIDESYGHLFRDETARTPLDESLLQAHGITQGIDENGELYVDVPDELLTQLQILTPQVAPAVQPETPPTTDQSQEHPFDQTSVFHFARHRNGSADVKLKGVDLRDEHIRGFLATLSGMQQPAPVAPAIQPTEFEPSAIVQGELQETAVQIDKTPLNGIAFSEVEDCQPQESKHETAKRIGKGALFVGKVALAAWVLQKSYGFASGGQNFFEFSQPTHLIDRPVGDVQHTFDVINAIRTFGLSILGKS